MTTKSPKPKPSMSREAYKGLGDTCWALHSDLGRIIKDCNDQEIVGVLKAARTNVADCGRMSDRRGAGH